MAGCKEISVWGPLAYLNSTRQDEKIDSGTIEQGRCRRCRRRINLT